MKNLSSSDFDFSSRMLATTKANWTLSGATCDSPRVDTENQVMSFFRQNTLLLPRPVMSRTFPWRIRWGRHISFGLHYVKITLICSFINLFWSFLKPVLPHLKDLKFFMDAFVKIQDSAPKGARTLNSLSLECKLGSLLLKWFSVLVEVALAFSIRLFIPTFHNPSRQCLLF